MPLKFRHHDGLRLFVEIAQYPSFSDAAAALNMTKGAISYQIKTLEDDLRLRLFQRSSRGVALTESGSQLLAIGQRHFHSIERGLMALKGMSTQSLTVGVSTYFAARWLSPLLMSFLETHADIQLRIQPMIKLFDLERQGIDIAIRWGNGDWTDAEITPFMPMPAFPVGNRAAAEAVRVQGIEQAFASFTLLRDHDDSNAWSDWFDATNLPRQTRRDTLIIPDPNVRVQAVIDGQGVALMDDLSQSEIIEEKLFRLSDQALSTYGYFLAVPRSKTLSAALGAFVDWIRLQQ
ncbi:LysR substrate-binding domain-containing protein [Pararhodobacter oceanensis]|uniref:LysR substrate-binding domain-containing protein n=1 Tax=Pararhodobacter oceanensis TaxID=2172121 RepID=UPI003A944FF2